MSIPESSGLPNGLGAKHRMMTHKEYRRLRRLQDTLYSDEDAHSEPSPPLRKRNRNKSNSTSGEAQERILPIADISFTTDILEKQRALWEEVKDAWASSASPSSCVPPPPPRFKVGTLEMYKRFPKEYEHFMRHHDCSAVKGILFEPPLPVKRTSLIRSTPNPGHATPLSGEEIWCSHLRSRSVSTLAFLFA